MQTTFSAKQLLPGALIAALMLAFAGSALADGVDRYPNLRESYDAGLQAGLERTLNRLGLIAPVRRNELAISLVDITDPHNPRVAEVNGDNMYYAASLPKIAILLGAFVSIDRGEMKLDPATRQSLTDMIRVSSNEQATRMLNAVGRNKVIAILKSERFRLYDPLVGGGLWVGKEYGKTPAYKRDPIHNLSHGATAMQTARFYYLMETGRICNSKLTGEMKAMLGNPGIEHKFVKGLAGRPGARIYRKSGSWRHWHSDSAVVESGGRKFIVVALAQNAKGGEWLSEIIAPLHDLVVPSRQLAARQ